MKNFSLALLMLLSGCELTPANWGFQKMRTLPTPEDPPLKCGTIVPADTLADQRASCTFKANSHASKIGTSCGTLCAGQSQRRRSSSSRCLLVSSPSGWPGLFEPAIRPAHPVSTPGVRERAHYSKDHHA